MSVEFVNDKEELQKIRQEQGGESAEEIRKKQGKVNLTTHNGEMLDQIEEAKANYGIGDSSKPPVTTDENSQPSPSPAPAQPNPPPQSTNNPPPAKPAASPKKKNGILLGPTMNFIKGALQGLAQGFKNVPKIIGRLFKK